VGEVFSYLSVDMHQTGCQLNCESPIYKHHATAVVGGIRKWLLPEVAVSEKLLHRNR